MKTSDELNRKSETLRLMGFQESASKSIFYILASILSFGILPIIAKYNTKLFARWTQQECSFTECSHVLIERFVSSSPDSTADSSQFDPSTAYRRLAPKRSSKFHLVQVVDLGPHLRYFEFRKEKFVLNSITNTFIHKPAQLKDLLPSQIYKRKAGLSGYEAHEAFVVDGPNKILIDNVPISTMFIEKVSQIFYLFQIASVIIWLVEGYTLYAWLILFLSASSICWEIYSAKKNEQQLRSLTELDSDFYVLRDGEIIKIRSEELVVGDAVILDSNSIFPNTRIPCDMVMVQGECLMDESSLTGETVPVLKLPLATAGANYETPLELERNRKNILFGGSTILQLKSKENLFRPPTRDPSAENLLDSTVAKTIKTQSSVTSFHLSPRPILDTSVIAIVLSTGFSTSKGELFRSILFPSEVELTFNKDSLSFLAILGCIAALAFLNKFIKGYIDGNNLFYTLVISLDLITIAVPPALPLILTVGISFSLARLKKGLIYCIDPERMHYAGRLDTMCWDKTGTITVPSLLFTGLHHPHEDCEVSLEKLDFSQTHLQSDPTCLERFMVVCHGLTRPEGDYLGHALDIETFKTTEWSIEASSTRTITHDSIDLPIIIKMQMRDSSIFLVKRFEFDAHLQRSSVVAVSKDCPAILYVKGSPEAIKSVCLPSSIPSNFESLCLRYSFDGFYVIACASKRLNQGLLSQHSTLSRTQLECDLEFNGFLLFQNPIKIQAFPTFSALSGANIQSIIITGDHALVAIHVAKQLNLCTKSVTLVDQNERGVYFMSINHVDDGQPFTEPQKFSLGQLPDYLVEDLSDVALTGQALNFLKKNDPALLETIMPKVIIFSRAKPDEKTWIIEWLIKSGKNVGMCGDGTNDCGALKAAHVGLALSSAEASIVAPFTSGQKQISDIVWVVKEGRCSLETAFLGFKYMILYPLIQLMISASLNELKTSLSSNQYLFDDMVLVTSLALFALYTEPRNELSKSKPVDTLFSREILVSLVGQLFLCIFWYSINAAAVFNSTWYCSVANATSKLDKDFIPIDGNLGSKANYPCYPIDAGLDTSLSFLIKSHENTALWTFGHFQFVIVIFAMSLVTQYRKPFWTNRIFTFYTGFTFLLLTLQLLFLVNTSTAKVPTESPQYLPYFSSWFNVAPGIPFSFRFWELVFVLLHVGCAVMLEYGWFWFSYKRSESKTLYAESAPLI